MIKDVEQNDFPALSLDYLKSLILKEEYHTFEGTTITLCILTLKNEFKVTGESACAAPENFDADKGIKYSYEDALEKMWKYEGYLLKQKLHDYKEGLKTDIGM